jgi:hypothetical protein
MGIASARQFTEVKVMHNAAMQYNSVDARDDPSEAAAVNKFQSQVRGQYIIQLKRKDHQMFSAMDRGPLETVF